MPQTPGLAVLDDASAALRTIPAPTQLFGATLFTAGLYTQSHGLFPQGTIALVYTKGDWRMMEIDYLPQTDPQKYLSSFLTQKEEIYLTKTQPAWIMSVDTNPRCIDYEDDIPNRCEISKQLVFAQNDRTIVIAVDGKHATQGELLEIAKSMLIVDGGMGE